MTNVAVFNNPLTNEVTILEPAYNDINRNEALTDNELLTRAVLSFYSKTGIDSANPYHVYDREFINSLDWSDRDTWTMEKFTQ